MCANHDKVKKNNIILSNIYLITIILALVAGFLDNQHINFFAGKVADIFIKIFKAISMPIISLSIIVTFSSFGEEESHDKIWKRTIFYTIFTTIIAATISFILYIIIKPENLLNIKLNSQHISSSKEGYLSHIMNIIPDNLLKPFLDHQIMGVLFVSVLIGIAISKIKEAKSKDTITSFFKGLHSIFFIITKWVVAILPIGFFAFIVNSIVEIKGGMDIKGLGKYLIIVLSSNVIQALIILPILLKLKGIKPFETMKLSMPALSLAFFSKSSAGTLPVTIETAENKLHISSKISRFVLPLCTTINMNGCAAFIFTTVIFVMQNHGIEITLATMIMWIFISTLAAIGNAGVPMGCFFLSASLLSSMDLDIQIMGLILPFYAIIDMVETSLNVWSDITVAKIVDKEII